MVDLVEECYDYYEIKFGRKNKVEKLPAGIKNSSTKKKRKMDKECRNPGVYSTCKAR